jgi:ubiquinone/menaquinone biosynthesis C-methylase UbiE
MSETDRVFAGSIPESYDRYLVPLIFESSAQEIAQRVAELSPSAVLETAAGSGVVTRALTPRLSPDAYVVTDLNQPMLDYAATRQVADSRVSWRKADGQALPFEDAAFDLICCQFGVMYFPDRQSGYREAKRVLKPGDHGVHQYYLTLASIIGDWLSERGRLKTEPIKKTLHTMANNLRDASAFLGGFETGIRTDIEIAISSRVLNLMALDPTIGSKARELLSSFRRDAERIAHVCNVAAADLPRGPSKRGRKALDWYDSFSALLLDVAEKAKIRPTLYKDRDIDDAPKGWLLDAARQVETFLPKEMRSPGDEARYKRLERSKVSLHQA